MNETANSSSWENRVKDLEAGQTAALNEVARIGAERDQLAESLKVVETFRRQNLDERDRAVRERAQALNENDRLRERVKLLEGMEGGEYAAANRYKAERDRLGEALERKGKPNIEDCDDPWTCCVHSPEDRQVLEGSE